MAAFDDFDPNDVDILVELIKPMFARRNPIIIGAALADLMAMFLAGHQGEGAEQLREELLAAHIVQVRRLIPVNEELMREQGIGGSRH